MKPIRASDIGSYLYCRRAWWYRLNGQESVNQAEMAAGPTCTASMVARCWPLASCARWPFSCCWPPAWLLTAFGLSTLLEAYDYSLRGGIPDRGCPGFILQSGRTQKAAGLPGGRMIYTDTRAWGKVESPCTTRGWVLPETGLSGREKRTLYPIEVKSGRAPQALTIAHLPVGFLLPAGRKNAGQPPAVWHHPLRGSRLRHRLHPVAEQALLDILAEMRRDERREEVERSHESRARCARCGFREVCDQKI